MADFKNEYEYLIHLVKCAINNIQPQEKPENLSFEKVFEYGKIHEVGNIAFVSLQRLENKPDEEVFKKWKTFYAFSLSRHANQLEVRKEILATFKKIGVRSLEAQGTVVKAFYPQPEWRMMTDIDFIIDRQNLEKVNQVMQNLGYKTKCSVNSNNVLFEVDVFGKYNTLIEIHSEFFERQNQESYGTITNPFETAEPTGEGLCYRLPDTEFYLFSLLHCIKHYLGKGAGIRRILDAYILKKQLYKKVDTEYVNSVLEKAGYLKTAEQIYALADKWFSSGEVCADLSAAEQLVFAAGNHGTGQIELSHEFEKSGKGNKLVFKLKKFFSRIFISKAEIYSAYPFCRKHRYPLFLCWIHRILCLIFIKKKRKQALNTISTIKDTQLK
ncbi:MAG: hypothetical protein E7539_02685 [Ruminococcaceae bacterium]|nr:hypothetical protein [Oscillospiraceae bacterium]